MATLYAADVRPPVRPQAVVLDLPTRTGPPIADGWPATWTVIAPAEKNCNRYCCSHKGLAVQQSGNVTVYQYQGITCGEH